MNELIKKVEQWFIDRNLHTGEPLKQWEKLVEEFGELVKGKNKNDVEMIKDSIGDMTVVLIGICLQMNIDLNLDENTTVDETNSTNDFLNVLSSLHYHVSEYDKYSEESNLICFKKYKDELLEMLNGVADDYKVTMYDCLSLAYDEIKERKGKLIDGVFVKEEDL